MRGAGATDYEYIRELCGRMKVSWIFSRLHRVSPRYGGGVSLFVYERKADSRTYGGRQCELAANLGGTTDFNPVLFDRTGFFCANRQSRFGRKTDEVACNDRWFSDKGASNANEEAKIPSLPIRTCKPLKKETKG